MGLLLHIHCFIHLRLGWCLLEGGRTRVDPVILKRVFKPTGISSGRALTAVEWFGVIAASNEFREKNSGMTQIRRSMQFFFFFFFCIRKGKQNTRAFEIVYISGFTGCRCTTAKLSKCSQQTCYTIPILCYTISYLMIGKILGFWLVNWPMIWSCIMNFLQFTSQNLVLTSQNLVLPSKHSCINLLLFRVGRVEHCFRWLMPMMQFRILPTPLSAWCNHQFSQTLQDGCPFSRQFSVHFYYLGRGRGGNHEINSLSTVLEYDTTYISQSEGCITLGCASGDTALWLRDISCIILQNSW